MSPNKRGQNISKAGLSDHKYKQKCNTMKGILMFYPISCLVDFGDTNMGQNNTKETIINFLLLSQKKPL